MVSEMIERGTGGDVAAGTTETQGRGQGPGGGNILCFIFVIASLTVMFWPGLTQHYIFASTLRYFQEDAMQQIFPYWENYQPGKMAAYYAGDYFKACMPLGYHGLLSLLSTFLNPFKVGVHLTYILYFCFLYAIGRTAFRLGGWSACWLVLAFCLSADVYLGRMSGGLARAFGFPLMALGMYTLVAGRIRRLMGLIVVSALFYPSAAILLGISVAALLLLCPKSMRGDATDWSFKRRMVCLAITGGLALAAVVPTVFRMAPYGPSISPRDVAAFPEAGPNGRYKEDDRAPFPGFVESVKRLAPTFLFSTRRLVSENKGYAGKAFYEPLRSWAYERNYKGELKRKDRFLPAVYLLAFIGVGGLLYRRPEKRIPILRILLLPLCAAGTYQIARYAAPFFYLPERYVIYTIPSFMGLFVATGLSAIPLWLGPTYRRFYSVLSAILLGGIPLGTFGGR